jgi:hypothetical protein
VNDRAARRLLLAYYASTPALLVLDLVFGLNLRTTFFDGAPWLRVAYYALAFFCAIAIARWPARAGLVGLVESGANISLLVLGVGLGYLRLVDATLAEQPLDDALFGMEETLNLIISAGALAVSYIAAQARASTEVRQR